MRSIVTLLALFFLQTSNADIKINSIADNSNYLFVETKTLPIIDINITVKNGSINDGDYPGITNLMLNVLMTSDINSKSIITILHQILYLAL